MTVTFNQTLRDNLNPIIAAGLSSESMRSMLPKRTWWNLTKSVLAFHFLRHFPALVGWLPAHTPHLAAGSPPPHSQLWKPRIVFQLRMQEGKPDAKKPPTLALSEKDPHMAIFYCGHRIAGRLCQ